MGARIVISETMAAGAVDALAADFEVLYRPDWHGDRPALTAALSNAAGLIVRNMTRVDAPLLAAAPGLRVVGRLGSGLDNIDTEACAARNIAVRPAAGANAGAVAEYVIAAMLVLRRRVFGATNAMLAGTWPRMAMIGQEVAGCRLGLLGFGATARAVARRAHGLEMRIGAFDPLSRAGIDACAHADWMDRDDLVAGSDIVSLHVPLNDTTRHLLDSARLATMRPGAIVINAARGGVVDEAALCAALRAGHLGGAALDVFATEPLDRAAAACFADVPNLLLTPHIAGVTAESMEQISTITANNIKQALLARCPGPVSGLT